MRKVQIFVYQGKLGWLSRLRRVTLTRNLNELITRVQNIFLPVNIQKVFVHGSYLRGDETPGDLDIFIIADVKDQWQKWYATFRDLSVHHNTLVECSNKGMSVSEAISSILPKLKNWNIPIEWFVCISWTDIFQGLMPYTLNWHKITKQLLTRGMKGVHIEIASVNFKHLSGRLYSYHDMPAFLVWLAEESERPGLMPNANEFQEYLQFENERLLKDLTDAQICHKFGRALFEMMLMQYPKDKRDDLTLHVFNNIIKSEVSEERLREELRKIGLPENLVFATGRKGHDCRYKLAKNIGEQKDFKQEARCDFVINNAKKMICSMLRGCLSKEESYGIMCHVTPQRCERSCVLQADGTNLKCSVTDLESGSVSVSVKKPDKMLKEEFKKQWTIRGFKVGGTSEYMYAKKTFVLRLDLSRKEMREIIINELKV